jgi:DNA invertase Pin-like site-specific DNA recombinase
MLASPPSLDQDLTIQHSALEAVEEKKCGTRRDGRTELQVLLECVREGDTVIVTRIDRLARSMKDLQDIVHELNEKGVSLKATEQPIDTRAYP